MNNLKLILYFFIFVILLGAGFYAGFKFNDNKVTYVTDTVVVNKIDSFVITKWKPYKVTVDSLIYDTLYDTLRVPHYVEVPLSKSLYSKRFIQDRDTANISMSITGYKTSVDSLNINLKTYREIIVLKPSVNKKTRYSIGFQVGYGAGEKGFSPYVGIGINLPILQF